MVGGVPQKTFEYLFSRATLPVTVAGHNALNLVKALGIPHLLATRGPLFRPGLNPRTGNSGNVNHLSPEELSAYIIALRSESALGEAYRNEATRHRLQPDLVESGLLALLEHSAKSPPAGGLDTFE